MPKDPNDLFEQYGIKPTEGNLALDTDPDDLFQQAGISPETHVSPIAETPQISEKPTMAGLGQVALRAATSFPKSVVGGAEAAGQLATGFAAFPISGLGMAGRFAYEKLRGRKPTEQEEALTELGLPALPIEVARDTDEALRKAEETGESISNLLVYKPVSEYGKIYSELGGKLIGLPAQAARAYGEAAITPEETDDIYTELGLPTGKLSPGMATAITTPLEFFLYGLVFKPFHSAKQALLKTKEASHVFTEKDLAKAEKIIQRADVNDTPVDVGRKLNEIYIRAYKREMGGAPPALPPGQGFELLEPEAGRAYRTGPTPQAGLAVRAPISRTLRRQGKRGQVYRTGPTAQAGLARPLEYEPEPAYRIGRAEQYPEVITREEAKKEWKDAKSIREKTEGPSPESRVGRGEVKGIRVRDVEKDRLEAKPPEEKVPKAEAEAPEGRAGETLSRNDVVSVLSQQSANKNKTKEYLSERWVASNNFTKMEIPVDSVGMASEPTGKAKTTGPIIVDKNIAEVGRYKGRYGAPPDVLVIDGKHRLKEAIDSGRETITAYVGDEARSYLEKQVKDKATQKNKIDKLTTEYLDPKNTSPGTTLRKLRQLLPEDKIEELRKQRKEAGAGEKVAEIADIAIAQVDVGPGNEVRFRVRKKRGKFTDGDATALAESLDEELHKYPVRSVTSPTRITKAIGGRVAEQSVTLQFANRKAAENAAEKLRGKEEVAPPAAKEPSRREARRERRAREVVVKQVALEGKKYTAKYIPEKDEVYVGIAGKVGPKVAPHEAGHYFENKVPDKIREIFIDEAETRFGEQGPPKAETEIFADLFARAYTNRSSKRFPKTVEALRDYIESENIKIKLEPVTAAGRFIPEPSPGRIVPPEELEKMGPPGETIGEHNLRMLKAKLRKGNLLPGEKAKVEAEIARLQERSLRHKPTPETSITIEAAPPAAKEPSRREARRERGRLSSDQVREITVTKTDQVNRRTANANDLAADYKARRLDRHLAWDEFIKDRGLKPELNAKDFFKIYDEVDPFILKGKTTSEKVKFKATHRKKATGELVQAEKPNEYGIAKTITEKGKAETDHIDNLELLTKPSRREARRERQKPAAPEVTPEVGDYIKFRTEGGQERTGDVSSIQEGKVYVVPDGGKNPVPVGEVISIERSGHRRERKEFEKAQKREPEITEREVEAKPETLSVDELQKLVNKQRGIIKRSRVERDANGNLVGMDKKARNNLGKLRELEQRLENAKSQGPKKFAAIPGVERIFKHNDISRVKPLRSAGMGERVQLGNGEVWEYRGISGYAADNAQRINGWERVRKQEFVARGIQGFPEKKEPTISDKEVEQIVEENRREKRRKRKAAEKPVVEEPVKSKAEKVFEEKRAPYVLEVKATKPKEQRAEIDKWLDDKLAALEKNPDIGEGAVLELRIGETSFEIPYATENLENLKAQLPKLTKGITPSALGLVPSKYAKRITPEGAKFWEKELKNIKDFETRMAAEEKRPSWKTKKELPQDLSYLEGLSTDQLAELRELAQRNLAEAKKAGKPKSITLDFLGLQTTYEKTKAWLKSVGRGDTAKARQTLQEIKDEYLQPTENSYDRAGIGYLKDRDMANYRKNMPSLEGIKPNEVFKHDPDSKKMIAAIFDKDGNMKPAIRQSGAFVGVEEYANKIENYKDIGKTDYMLQDPTRMFEAMDQGYHDGPNQRQVLFPARSNTLAKLAFADKNKQYVSEIQQKYKIISKRKKNATGDVIEYITDGNAWKKNTEQILNIKKVQDLLRRFKPEEKVQIIEAAQDLRKLYSKLLKQVNAARKLRAQKEIPFRKFYRQHVMEQNLWSKVFGLKKKPKDIMETPELPDFIKPDKPFNPRELPREGGLRDYVKKRDIIDLMADYIDTAGKDIFDTNIIHNTKIHAAVARNRGKLIMADAMETWAAERYAGIAPIITRAARKTLPETPRRAWLGLRRNLTRAVFPLNWTWNLFIQTSSAGITFARYGTRANLAGLKYFFNPVVRQAVRQNAYSSIVKSRYGGRLAYQDIQNAILKNKRLQGTRMERVEDFANGLTSAIEDALTGHAIVAAHHRGKQLGLKGRALWEFASNGGAKTQSMYNYHDVPGLLASKYVGATFPFQTFAFEVMNTVREMAPKKLHRFTGKAGAYETIAADSALGKSVMSRRLWMLTRFLGAVVVTNAVVEKAIGRKPWQFASFIPIIGPLVTGYQGYAPMLPQQYVTEFKKGLRDVVVYGNFNKMRKWAVRYHVPAGLQLNRIYDGIQASAEGRVKDVRNRTLFKVAGPAEKAKAITMGPYRTEAGKEYIKKRRESQGFFHKPKPKGSGRSRRSRRSSRKSSRD